MRKRGIFIGLICLCLLLNLMSANTVYGANINQKKLITKALTAYFDARNNGDKEKLLACAVKGIYNDEFVHDNELKKKNIYILNEKYIIESLKDESGGAYALVKVCVFYDDGYIENVFHQIELACNNDNKWLVCADSYAEEHTGFISCSFTPAEDMVERIFPKQATSYIKE